MTYVHQRKFDSATPVSRLDLLHSLVIDGSFRIDHYQTNTPDVAIFEGHYYSDKAPGTTAVAFLPFVTAAAILKAAGIPLDSRPGWFLSDWFAGAFSLAAITSLGGVALFAWLRRYVPPKTAFITTLAIFLGAAPLPYATLMFSHSMVVGLLGIALWAASNATGPDAKRWDMLAGFVSGLALASEYTAGLIFMGLLVWRIQKGRPHARGFILGAIPPLLLIPAYSWICLNNPFSLPYSYQASFPEMQAGLYAIKLPDAKIAAQLLALPQRGLFFYTPFLLIAFAGFATIWRRDLALFYLLCIVPAIHVIVISGRAWDWTAGNTIGPRYLAPILPLIALPSAIGARRFPRIAVMLCATSILFTTMATLTDACPEDTVVNPLTESFLPLFLRADLSPCWSDAFGLNRYWSLAFYYAVIGGFIAYLWKNLNGTGAKV